MILKRSAESEIKIMKLFEIRRIELISSVFIVHSSTLLVITQREKRRKSRRENMERRNNKTALPLRNLRAARESESVQSSSRHLFTAMCGNKKWTINFRFCSSEYLRYLFDFVSSSRCFACCIIYVDVHEFAMLESFTLNNGKEKTIAKIWVLLKNFDVPSIKKSCYLERSLSQSIWQSIRKWKWKIIIFPVDVCCAKKLRDRRNEEIDFCERQ